MEIFKSITCQPCMEYLVTIIKLLIYNISLLGLLTKIVEFMQYNLNKFKYLIKLKGKCLI
jgi:hypothetical protein